MESEKSKNLILNIERTLWDKFLLLLPWLILLICLYWVQSHYHQLPDRIPTHFDLVGQPDSWGDRSSVWFLFIPMVLLIVLLQGIQKWPHAFNYPITIESHNAEYQYRLARRLLSYLAVVVALLFGFLIFRSISIALENHTTLSPWFGILLGVFFLVAMTVYFVQVSQEPAKDSSAAQ